ncbi:MAG TPA: tetratricopeptide repeat protein [Ramlibacter sp.]|nr:tetratricopeptide repeat protein [Ramlibacter sp.]
MDTFRLDFLSGLDDALARARAEFGRHEYAQALSTIGGLPEYFGSQADILELKAKSCEALGRFDDAASEWAKLLQLDPSNTTAQRQLAWCNSRIGTAELLKEPKAFFDRSKFAETIASLEAGPPEWRGHPEFHRMAAISNERLGNWGTALSSWHGLLAIAPSDQDALVRVPMCHALIGDMESAAEGFEAAADRFPDNMTAQFNWLSHRIRMAPAGKGISLALEEIRRLWTRTCNSQAFKSQLDPFKTRLLALFDPAELAARDTDGLLQLAAIAKGVDESLRSIYEQFEPVGNNCEFGNAQRKHSVEPLALFRWTAVTPENLVRLLADRLEGYEDPAHYRLEENPGREFLLKEDVYQTASHTYVKSHEADAAALLAKLARRQAFLKRKFIETAAEGRKIFVYKFDQRLEAQTMDAIQQGLEALGARKFLFVMRASADDKAGTVRTESTNRVVGFISDVLPNTQFLEWDEIVTQAWRHLS